VTVAVKRPTAAANCPVPPAILLVWWTVAVNTQLRGLADSEKSRMVS
jgi:hypothetical protein